MPITTTGGESTYDLKLTQRSWLANLGNLWPYGGDTLGKLLDCQAERLDAGATELGRVYFTLGAPGLDETLRRLYSRNDYPGHDTYVRYNAKAARSCPWISGPLHIEPKQLDEDISKKGCLENLQLGMAVLKSKSMDTLLTNSRFSVFVLVRMLDWLNAELGKASEDEATDLMRDFGPLLVLLKQDQGWKLDRQNQQTAKEDELVQLAEEANKEVQILQAKMDARQGKTPAPEAVRAAAEQAAQSHKAHKGQKAAKGQGRKAPR